MYVSALTAKLKADQVSGTKREELSVELEQIINLGINCAADEGNYETHIKVQEKYIPVYNDHIVRLQRSGYYVLVDRKENIISIYW